MFRSSGFTSLLIITTTMSIRGVRVKRNGYSEKGEKNDEREKKNEKIQHPPLHYISTKQVLK